jgi:hypothetical protein
MSCLVVLFTFGIFRKILYTLRNKCQSSLPLGAGCSVRCGAGMSLIQYLSQGGPYHPKHGGGGGDFDCNRSSELENSSRNNKDRVAVDNYYLLPLKHPLLAFTIHYIIAIATIFFIHDNFFIGVVVDDVEEKQQHQFQQEQSLQQYESYHEQTTQRDITSTFLICYTLLLFITR